ASRTRWSRRSTASSRTTPTTSARSSSWPSISRASAGSRSPFRAASRKNSTPGCGRSPDRMRLPAAAILTLLAASAQPAAPRSDAVVVLCDRFFDGHSIVSGPARIWIENGRVARIEKGGAPPGQTPRAYDLAGLTVLPGLIDLHAHVAWHFNAAGKLHTDE